MTFHSQLNGHMESHKIPWFQSPPTSILLQMFHHRFHGNAGNPPCWPTIWKFHGSSHHQPVISNSASHHPFQPISVVPVRWSQEFHSNSTSWSMGRSWKMLPFNLGRSWGQWRCDIVTLRYIFILVYFSLSLLPSQGVQQSLFELVYLQVVNLVILFITIDLFIMIYSHWNFQHGSRSKPRYPWHPKIDAYWIVIPANIVIIGFDPSPHDGISTHVQCLDVPNLEFFWANLWMVPGLPAMWRGDESFTQMLSARKPLGDGAEPDLSSQEMWNADFDPGIAPKCRRSFSTIMCPLVNIPKTVENDHF